MTGLSIVRACLEHPLEVDRSRTLFATHYHDLTVLAAKLAAVACRKMRVKKWKGRGRARPQGGALTGKLDEKVAR